MTIKGDTVWERKTPIGTFSIQCGGWDIRKSDINKFTPLWNGCGIGKTRKTIGSAKTECFKWEQRYLENEISKIGSRLVELICFKKEQDYDKNEI